MIASVKSTISPFIPSDPLMAQAWVDCLRWATTAPEIVARFTADTGYAFTSPAFVPWFHQNVWSAEECYDLPPVSLEAD